MLKRLIFQYLEESYHHHSVVFQKDMREGTDFETPLAGSSRL
jgi:hypothetical protein